MDVRDEAINRLWHHVRSLHRLNGWSKRKGWWCSCGAEHSRVVWQDADVRPWTDEGREIAKLQHTAHLIVLRRHLLTGEELPPNHKGYQ